ncbi:MAG: hypothetical protein NVS3B26_24860 [Mycobacteriales bacterium]
MSTPPKETRGNGGWWLAIPAVAVLCCAGPALLTAVGVGSIATLIGGTSGRLAIAVAGLLLLGAAAAFAVRRRIRR